MQTSLPVASNQAGPHEDLQATVRKHLAHAYRRPIPVWVDELAEQIVSARAGRELILDSGCGSGHSSVQIAHNNPDCLVLGIDQSAHRLQRSPLALQSRPEGIHGSIAASESLNTVLSQQGLPDNLQYVRADVQDLWRALLDHGVRLHSHYLLYPNPWPKAHHLMRRWHGHPVWPTLLALGGQLELRTNWDIYAHEFHQALLMSGIASINMDTLSNSDAVAHPMSLFEKKYAVSKHALWQVNADLQNWNQSEISHTENTD